MKSLKKVSFSTNNRLRSIVIALHTKLHKSFAFVCVMIMMTVNNKVELFLIRHNGSFDSRIHTHAHLYFLIVPTIHDNNTTMWKSVGKYVENLSCLDIYLVNILPFFFSLTTFLYGYTLLIWYVDMMIKVHPWRTLEKC